MGARGPAPTPTAILALRGSWRAKVRTGEPQPTKGKPVCPRHLTPKQKWIWRRLCRMLDQMNILTIVDGSQIERYCVYYCRWRECEEFIARNGISYPIKSDEPTYYVVRMPGSTTAVIGFVEHPQLRESHRLDVSLKQIEMQFGLTPAARTRLTADSSPTAGSLSEFVRKRG